MEVTLSIKIQSGNAAFGDTDTVAREETALILRKLANNILRRKEHNKIMDSYGNNVGELFFEVLED